MPLEPNRAQEVIRQRRRRRARVVSRHVLVRLIKRYDPTHGRRGPRRGWSRGRRTALLEEDRETDVEKRAGHLGRHAGAREVDNGERPGSGIPLRTRHSMFTARGRPLDHEALEGLEALVERDGLVAREVLGLDAPLETRVVEGPDGSRLLLLDAHVAQDPLDDVEVEGQAPLADGHEVEHALGVEVRLVDPEGFDLYVWDVLVGFLYIASALDMCCICSTPEQ